MTKEIKREVSAAEKLDSKRISFSIKTITTDLDEKIEKTSIKELQNRIASIENAIKATQENQGAVMKKFDQGIKFLENQKKELEEKIDEAIVLGVVEDMD